jgi:hypothetical protein
MKRAISLLLAVAFAHVLLSQKLMLGGQVPTATMSYEAFMALRTLDCSDKTVTIQSFSITFQLYGRPMEIACQGNTFSEEVYEGTELLYTRGAAPKSLTFTKVVAFRGQKKVEFMPLTIELKP